jgi:type III restriction enzyme
VGDLKEYIQRVPQAINKIKRHYLVEGIQHLEEGKHYDLGLFEPFEGHEDILLPIEKSIYDQVIFDSDIEKGFAETLEAMVEEKLFIKLPDWFLVTTPIGDYNPDWAVVFHVQDEFGEIREKL